METPEEKKKEIRINNSILKIEANDDTIVITLNPAMSYYKYKNEFILDELKVYLDLEEQKNINEVYELLTSAKYTLLPEEKTIKINNKNISLKKIALTNDEIIRSLMDGMKEMTEKNKNQCELINKLLKSNKEKEKRIKKLENNVKTLKEEMYE